MAELNTLARPYAKAAFEAAHREGELSAWSAQLGVAAAVSRDDRIAGVLGNPSYTAEQMARTVIEVCGDALTESGRGFLRVLASNGRLPLLPQIFALFQQYRAGREKSVEVEFVTAFALREADRRKLAEVLSGRLERAVKVETTLDESLLGGVLIRAGDLVIDGSVRGRLDKLAEAMNT